VNQWTVDSCWQVSSRNGTLVLQRAIRPWSDVISVEKCNQPRNPFRKYVEPFNTFTNKVCISVNLLRSEMTLWVSLTVKYSLPWKVGYVLILGFHTMSIIMLIMILGSGVMCKKAVLPVFVGSSCPHLQMLSQEVEWCVRKGKTDRGCVWGYRNFQTLHERDLIGMRCRSKLSALLTVHSP
jgi:hypothetical protein